MEIVFWTIGCGQCKVLQKKLDNAGLQYQVENDAEKMNALGIKSLPRLSVNGEDMGYSEAVKWINEYSKSGGQCV